MVWKNIFFHTQVLITAQGENVNLQLPTTMDIESRHQVERAPVFSDCNDDELVILYGTAKSGSVHSCSFGSPSPSLRPSRRPNRRDARANAKHSAFHRRRKVLLLCNVLALFFVVSMVSGSYFTAWNVAFNVTRSRNLSTVRQPGEILSVAFGKSIRDSAVVGQPDELRSDAFDKSVLLPAENP